MRFITTSSIRRDKPDSLLALEDTHFPLQMYLKCVSAATEVEVYEKNVSPSKYIVIKTALSMLITTITINILFATENGYAETRFRCTCSEKLIPIPHRIHNATVTQ